jgi:hypothetical protein
MMFRVVLLFLLVVLVWFQIPKPNLNTPKQPKTKLFSKIRSQMRTGDLIMTMSSNNVVSELQQFWLSTPITHVGIAVVENEGNELTRVFMFESSLPRGAQLRDLEDYARDGVHDVFVQHLNREEFKISRESLLHTIESFANSAYSFRYIADIPYKMIGLELGNDTRYDEKEKNISDKSYSCGDLVYQVYDKMNLMQKSTSKRRWFPKDFYTNKVLFKEGAFSELQSIYFDDLENSDRKRLSQKFQNVFSLLHKTFV